VQAAVQYGNEGGTAFGVESVMIPSPGAQVLALGDLLLGTRRGRLPVPLGDGTELNLAPGGVIHRSDGLDLAVEVFGLAAGQETTLRLYLAPQTGTDDGSGRFPKWQPFPNRRAHVRISRASGSSTIVRWRVGLPLKRLKPGSWTMAVVATDPTGKLARREARLELVVP
jgi:hypothetical protein